MIPKSKKALSILPIIGLAALAVFILREPLLMGKSALQFDLKKLPPWENQDRIYPKDGAGYKQAFEEYPNKVIYKDALTKCPLPLWNNRISNGYPVGADERYGWYDPFNLIFTFSSVETGLKLLAFVELLFIGLFSYLYLREIGLGMSPSWLGGAFSMSTTPIITHVMEPTILQSAMWFPFLLLMFERMCGRKTQPYLLLISLGTALSILGGDLIFSAITIGGFAVYAFARILFAGAWECLESKPKRLAMLVLAIILGMLLTAPQFLPAIELANFSSSLHLFPSFYLNAPERSYTWIVILIIVIWGIRFRHKDRRVVILAGLALITIIFSREQFFDYFGQSFFEFYTGLRLMAGTSAALLAGFGLEELLGVLTSKHRRFAFAFLWPALVISATAGFWNYHSALFVNQEFSGPAPTDSIFYAYFAVALGSAAAILFLILSWLKSGKAIKAALVILLALTGPLVFAGHYLKFQENGYMSDMPKSVKWLQAHSANWNTIKFPFHFHRNYLLVYGISELQSRGSRTLNRFDDYFTAVVSSRGIDPKSRTIPINFILLDAMNLRFLLTEKSLSEEIIQGRWEQVFADGAYIYENSEAYPKAWFVTEASLVHDVNKAFDAISADGFDPSKVVVIEAEEQGFLKGSPGSAKILELSPGHAVFDVDAPDGGWLVFGETYYPGWEATIDGEPYPVYKADVAFMAVPLMPGEKRVEFNFKSFWRTVGYYVAAAAACALIIVFIWQLKEKPAKSPVCS